MCSGLMIHAFKYSTVSAGRLDERPDPDFGVAMFRKSIADMVWLMLLTSSVCLDWTASSGSCFPSFL